MLLGLAASAQEFGAWSQPVNLGPALNSSSEDMHPSISKDGLSLYFSSNRPGSAGGLDLWVSQRDSLDSPWQPPQNVTMLNSTFDDHAANLTMDGHWLFFYSTRPGGCNVGRQELWASHRQNKRDDFGWEPPINLGCSINAPATDNGGPGYWQDDADGTHYLYFARNYTPAVANGFSIHVTTCLADLKSCNEQQLWSSPIPVAELNSPGFRNTKTGIRHRDKLEIIVTSNRSGSVGSSLDLWVATRASILEPWQLPENLNLENLDNCLEQEIGPASCPSVNTTSADGAAALSWDGLTLLLYSGRAGGLGGNDLYVSTRQKVPQSQ